MWWMWWSKTPWGSRPAHACSSQPRKAPPTSVCCQSGPPGSGQARCVGGPLNALLLAGPRPPPRSRCLDCASSSTSLWRSLPRTFGGKASAPGPARWQRAGRGGRPGRCGVGDCAAAHTLCFRGVCVSPESAEQLSQQRCAWHWLTFPLPETGPPK